MIGGTGHEIYVQEPERRRSTSASSVMHVGEPIRDIDSRRNLGYQAAYVATAVVKAPGEVSKAVLTEGAREALEGDRLITAGRRTVARPSRRMRRRRQSTARSSRVADNAAQIGQYQVVVLNRGANRRPRARARCSPIDQQGAIVSDKIGE